MSTNPEFDERELELILITIYKARCTLFDCVEFGWDYRSMGTDPKKGIPKWKGKRGTFPLLEDLDKTLALIRLHVNSEETIQLYDAMGTFDYPKKKKGPKPL